MGLSLLDRANISSAYVIGMKNDLNMGIGKHGQWSRTVIDLGGLTPSAVNRGALLAVAPGVLHRLWPS